MQNYEKLGVFYLGRTVDPSTRKRGDAPLLFDSRDLVTHAICVGMTGSGKTGLCIDLIEEAAIDGVPALVIDPKGDLGNLLLTFPQLRPEDFRPWINEDDARRQGVEPDAFAAAQAELWRKGLAEWDQQPDRIQRLRDAAEFAIYTPGSETGRPVSILASFAAPTPAVLADPDIFRQRIVTTVTGLLGLIGIEADPIQSREHILISSLLDAAWRSGQGLDLAGLVAQVQKPPLQRVGVLELESFYPAKDRFELAMRLNNLLAAPTFAAWTKGEPLDVGALLHDPQGKPRVSIFSIAHLGDAERMFFVALLLSEVVGWMRSQSGTTSLRALLYMDEVFGYMPPTANPPTKLPLLTLFKQARAFGVGVVLATQNPVDLDYKALSNAGTWWLGRLQTERDKLRVLDGLEGATAGAIDRAALDRLLSGLGKRMFLQQSAHENEPTLFESRWAMSYLRGPLTLRQVQSLCAPQAGASASPGPSAAATAVGGSQGPRPVLPPEIDQAFLPLRDAGSSDKLVYGAALLGLARVQYTDAKAGVDTSEDVGLLLPLGDASVDWQAAERTQVEEKDLEREPVTAAGFSSLPSAAGTGKSYPKWSKDLGDFLFRTAKLELRRSPSSGEVSRPGESERDFRVRLGDAGRAQRDAETDAIRQRYAPKAAALEERIRRAQQAVEREKSQATERGVQAALSVGAAVLSAFLGRKMISATSVSKAATAAKSVSRAAGEAGDIGRASESVEALTQQLAEVHAQCDRELQDLAAKADPRSETLESVVVRPKKSGIEVRRVLLAWAPYVVGPGGERRPSWG
ncbi:MAG: ATP-binding protein [Acidobacteriota bacterium]